MELVPRFHCILSTFAILAVVQPFSSELFACVAAESSADGALPHFKWGQTREKLFITVAVRDLDKSSVNIEFGEDTVSFHASDASGKAFDLNLEFAQDIQVEASRWEHLQRPDRWGVAVLASLTKKFPGRWEKLVEEPAKYRKVMDHDWSREDQQLEPLEEDSYFSEHKKFLPLLTTSSVMSSRAGIEALVVNVRHKECDQCRVADDTFAKVAKHLASKKKAPWHRKIRMAVVDARNERHLARSIGGFCSPAPQNCRYFVLAHGGGDEPVRIRARHEESPLLADLENLAREQFRPEPAELASQGRFNESRALIVLGPAAPKEGHLAAHRLRLLADVAVSAQQSASSVAIYPPGEREAYKYDESMGALGPWLQARAVAPLANISEFEEDEPYEDMELPVARLFLNGDVADSAARSTVHKLARRFVGRVALVARNASKKAHEWRQHGLPPGRFPSFGIGMSMAHNTSRYAFLDMPPVPPGHDNASVDVPFWTGHAEEALSTFIEDVLAQKIQPSLPSDDMPVDENLRWGSVMKLVGRACRSVVESSVNDTLIEVYDEWRRDHLNRTRHLDMLAPILARWNISVFRLDLGYNECPADTIPIISAGYSGYFFVSKMAKQRKLKPARMKKLDPSFAAVLKFIAKSSEASLSDSIPVIQQELAAAMWPFEKQEQVEQMWQDWMSGPSRKYSITGLLGFIGIAVFFFLRRQKVSAEFGPAPPAVETRTRTAAS